MTARRPAKIAADIRTGQYVRAIEQAELAHELDE